jgi:hypothetical protein
MVSVFESQPSCGLIILFSRGRVSSGVAVFAIAKHFLQSKSIPYKGKRANGGCALLKPLA